MKKTTFTLLITLSLILLPLSLARALDFHSLEYAKDKNIPLKPGICGLLSTQVPIVEDLKVAVEGHKTALCNTNLECATATTYFDYVAQAETKVHFLNARECGVPFLHKKITELEPVNSQNESDNSMSVDEFSKEKIPAKIDILKKATSTILNPDVLKNTLCNSLLENEKDTLETIYDSFSSVNTSGMDENAMGLTYNYCTAIYKAKDQASDLYDDLCNTDGLDNLEDMVTDCDKFKNDPNSGYYYGGDGAW